METSFFIIKSSVAGDLRESVREVIARVMHVLPGTFDVKMPEVIFFELKKFRRRKLGMAYRRAGKIILYIKPVINERELQTVIVHELRHFKGERHNGTTLKCAQSDSEKKYVDFLLRGM